MCTSFSLENGPHGGADYWTGAAAQEFIKGMNVTTSELESRLTLVFEGHCPAHPDQSLEIFQLDESFLAHRAVHRPPSELVSDRWGQCPLCKSVWQAYSDPDLICCLYPSCGQEVIAKTEALKKEKASC